MDPVKIPLAANWNLISSTAACPDGGFLYIGFKSVNYISAIKDDEVPVIKAISMRQKIKSIDCDPDWSETKYFAALADDNTVQVWDLNASQAEKGHKAHIKTSIGDGDGPPDSVAMCFLQNRTVLSIDSTCIVKYCVSSNRYTKNKRILSNKHKITIAKGSPYDENLIAFGSVRGLIFLVNLATETIVSTFCGHSRDITSFSWIMAPAPTQPRPTKTPVRKFSRKLAAAQNASTDDVFDIYDFDYLENEFGVPARLDAKIPSDAESADNEPQDAPSNENFNFIEACKSLKDDILARNREDAFQDSPARQQRQVTLEDCQQAIHDREETCTSRSFECDSELSVEFPESSEDSLLEDFQNNCTLTSNVDSNGLSKERATSQDVFLASGSLDGSVWIWNTRTGESVDQISLKGPHNQHGNNYIEVTWLNANTLITNNKSCELAIYAAGPSANKKVEFKREKHESKQRNVVGLCKMVNCPIVWTISSRRELVCENIETKQTLAKYSCAVTGVSAIRENPGDMNRVAIGFPDRRIGLMSLGSITPTNITMECLTLKEDTQIVSLCWSSNARYLAFGTGEGRVGVFDSEKTTGPIVLMKPFSGKPVYSLAWSSNTIFACSQEKVAYYEWNGKAQHATKLDSIKQASTIALHENLLLVGTQNGDVVLYTRSDGSSVDFKLISAKHTSSKYISEISFNPLNPTLVAVSAPSNNVTILKIVDLCLETDRILGTHDFQPGNPWVKWSNKNENLLLSCGFDGSIAIWNLSQPKQELTFVKHFDSPMLCAIFSPINEDIVICAGKATSIEMFNYLLTRTENLGKGKHKKKHLGEVQWGTRLDNAAPLKKKSKQKQKDNKVDDGNLEMLERLKSIKGEGNDIPMESDSNSNFIAKNPSTILHLLAKELNKDTLQSIRNVLENNSESPLISEKLFGSRQDAEDIMNAEMKNHEISNTKSIGRTLIPQITGNLKEEIVQCIKSKKLNETHISLAPTISYDFWKKCCKAYANQLLEIGLVLNAASYLLACHEIRESVDYLMEKHYYREAWIIAKMHIDSRDPMFDDLLKTWVEHISSTGNYEGAALLCTLAGNYSGALKCLSERRQQTDEHREVMEALETKVPI